MKLLEFNIDGKKLKIERNILGNEKIFMNDKLVSQKRSFFGTNHKIEINRTKYHIKYIVKDAWKKRTGKPVIQINSDGALVSEHYIKNRSFIILQFAIGLIATYCLYLFIMMIIESAKNGFVHYAH